MISLLINVLALAGIVCTIFGAFVLIMLGQSVKKPGDKSNRINRVRLVWFALTRPEMFAPHFEWMRRDEYDNVKGGE